MAYKFTEGNKNEAVANVIYTAQQVDLIVGNKAQALVEPVVLAAAALDGAAAAGADEDDLGTFEDELAARIKAFVKAAQRDMRPRRF